MSDFNFMFSLIPESAYKYIVLSILILFVFWKRIPVLNKIDVRIRLPEEFMRNFRWITPLMVAGLYIMTLIIYMRLKLILEAVSIAR